MAADAGSAACAKQARRPDDAISLRSDVVSGIGRRLRVVTLVERLGRFGGAEQLALAIATRLDPERFESTLVASRWTEHRDDPHVDEALADLASANVRFIGMDRTSTKDIAPWWRLTSLLRRERVDVLHSHMFGSNVWGTVTGRLAQVPVLVAHEHTWDFEGQPLRQVLDRELIARFGDAFVAVSREDQRRMVEVEGIDRADTVFLPNGIPDLAPASGSTIAAEIGIRNGAPVIGSVSTLRPEKRTDVLIRASAGLAQQFPGLQVLVAGGGEGFDSMQALVADLGLGDTVLLLGPRQDVPELLAILDVAVNCSEREGSPLSVMEYMDAGLPIVATRVGGTPDLIDDGVHGLIVEPGDSDALGGAIGQMLNDPARAHAMGEAARRRRRAEFSIDVMVKRLEALYERLYAESSRGRSRRTAGNSR